MSYSLQPLEMWILAKLVSAHVYEGWLEAWELRHKPSPTLFIHSQGMPECERGKRVSWRESWENVLFWITERLWKK